MSLQKEMYDALHVEYPNVSSDAELSRLTGLTHTMVSRLKNGSGIALKGADLLLEINPDKYGDLHRRAIKYNEKNQRKWLATRSRTNAENVSSFDISKMSTRARNMCGYVG